MKRLLLLMAPLVASCEPEPVADIPAMVHCTDTRDGQSFSYDNETARAVGAYQGRGVCFSVDDTEGGIRQICYDHLQSWLECEIKPK